MNWQIFISAFGLGLLSSFHCVGMCGAIAFSLPTQHLSSIKKAVGILSYNAGRIITYATVGIFFGVLGRQINILGFQRWFSIIAGLTILLIVVQTYLRKPILHFPGYSVVNAFVQKLIGKYISNPSISGTFLLGVANGFLPCGLVYLALTGALAAGTIEGSAFFMIAFGLGTFPAMFLLSYFGVFISISTRNTIRKTVPYVVAFMGLLLIMRGVGLGIPYLSPSIAISNGQVESCH